MTRARYDEVAEFYEAGWPDRYDDPVTSALLAAAGVVDGQDVLDVACGHGRISRELARRGGRVVGVDLSQRLVERAQVSELERPLGIRYVVGDVSRKGCLAGEGPFDVAVCSFGLSDIDDLDGAVREVAQALRPGGRFVFSILHPCFPGGPDVSGSWPSGGTYYDERWWAADASRSSLRRQVGANHRMLSTYVNTLARHGLGLHELAEPAPPVEWAEASPAAARHPVFLVASCRLILSE